MDYMVDKLVGWLALLPWVRGRGVFDICRVDGRWVGRYGIAYIV